MTGIEDWIAACRAATPEHATLLCRIEDALHGLDLVGLERLATQALRQREASANDENRLR